MRTTSLLMQQMRKRKFASSFAAVSRPIHCSKCQVAYLKVDHTCFGGGCCCCCVAFSRLTVQQRKNDSVDAVEAFVSCVTGQHTSAQPGEAEVYIALRSHPSGCVKQAKLFAAVDDVLAKLIATNEGNWMCYSKRWRNRLSA